MIRILLMFVGFVTFMTAVTLRLNELDQRITALEGSPNRAATTIWCSRKMTVMTNTGVAAEVCAP